jgi:succinate dehydrogenase / fumarate reductase cytochrome b subunit
MTESTRPLSPHLQVYRWQVSNTLSILHRATGAALSLAAVALVAGLLALAAGQSAFAQFLWIFTGLPGQLLMVAWSFCFFYHLCNGVRHLAWDIGRGFDKQVARRSGLFVVAASTVLTLAFWVGLRAGVLA